MISPNRIDSNRYEDLIANFSNRLFFKAELLACITSGAQSQELDDFIRIIHGELVNMLDAYIPILNHRRSGEITEHKLPMPYLLETWHSEISTVQLDGDHVRKFPDTLFRFTWRLLVAKGYIKRRFNVINHPLNGCNLVLYATVRNVAQPDGSNQPVDVIKLVVRQDGEQNLCRCTIL
jgi:hypothetical protein